MKKCMCCGAVCGADDQSCVCCGEASWSEVEPAKAQKQQFAVVEPKYSGKHKGSK